MKRIMYFVLVVLAGTLSSCLTSGLEELPAFDEANITDVYLEHRYTMTANGNTVVNSQRLTMTKSIDAEQAAIAVNATVPAANAAFPESEREKVNLNSIAVYCYLSTAASIEPVDSSPRLGTVGNYSSATKYKVTAADGKTSKIWTITVTLQK